MALRKQHSNDDHINKSDNGEDTLEKTIPKNRVFKRERRPINPDVLESSLRLREEIMKDRNGELFEDSTEMIRQMRKERIQHLMDVIEGKED